MSTWTANADQFDHRWTVIVRVEGLGPWLSDADLALEAGDARFRWCVGIPSYAAVGAVWLPTISSLPDATGEALDPLEGGAVRLDSTDVGLLDTDDLTALLATDEPSVTSLGAALPASTLGASEVVTVGSSAGMAGRVIYVAGETLRVEEVLSPTSIQATRGWAGSRALDHELGDPVHLSPPFLEGRRLEIHLAPLDGDSAATERAIGEYRIDGVEWGQVLREWRLQGVGQLRTLARLVAREPRVWTVSRVYDPEAAKGSGGWIRLEGAELSGARLWLTDPEVAYFRSGSEILTSTFEGVLGSSLRTGRRGVAFTAVEDLSEGSELAQVFVAEPEPPGSFRWSPGPTPSTSRTSGTWETTAQWLRLLMILLTSSAARADGLELTNYVAGGDNYSSLPPGFGAGHPASEVDWASVNEAIMRTEGLDLPGFAFGDEPVSFADLVVENLLRPVGAYLMYSAGQVRVVLPRLPLGRASVQIGPQDILTRKVGPGLIEPRIQVRRASSSAPSEIVYALGPQGRKVTARAPAVRASIGQRGEYGDPAPTTIPVPGADPNDGARWEVRGQTLLARASKPAIEVEMDVDPGLGLEVLPGEVVGVSLEGLPDATKRTRGWSEVNVQIMQQTPVTERDAVYARLVGQGYGAAAKLGAVAPAGRPQGVAGAVATLYPNVYTEPDAVGLPTSDAAAFTVGDVVRLLNLDGTEAAPGLVETVNTISGHELTLSGDFAGALAVDLVIECASYDDATAAQRSAFAFYADRATRTVGSGPEPPYRYAEP